MAATIDHPFLDGRTKRLLIGGAWVEAVSGETFDVYNPSTGAVIAQVARGGPRDIDRAVAASGRETVGSAGVRCNKMSIAIESQEVDDSPPSKAVLATPLRSAARSRRTSARSRTRLHAAAPDDLGRASRAQRPSTTLNENLPGP